MPGGELHFALDIANRLRYGVRMTPDFSVQDVLELCRHDRLTPEAAAELESAVQDGLEEGFVEEAGIETIDQHLADVLDRLVDRVTYHQNLSKQGFTVSTSTGAKSDGNQSSKDLVNHLKAAIRAVKSAQASI